jgi:LmbE family N-acetylglucosaminyl deacetylase
LIIAPHTDDEILGCFGLIDSIKKNGGKVYVQVMTLGGYLKIGGTNVTKEK